MTEVEIIVKAKGMYRHEPDQGWKEEKYKHLVDFEQGDHICIDPFSRMTVHDSQVLWPVFGEFVEYVTEDIAKVYIPEGSEDSNTWFNEPEGEYLIHEAYLTPQ